MRTIKKEYKVYNFNELDESIQLKAVEKLWDINVDHDWYDHIVEDLKTIGCGLVGFDIDRGSYCEIDFSQNYLIDVAKLIIKNHGEHSETYKLAESYIKHYEELKDNEDSDELMVFNKEFIDGLQEEYLSMLRKEYEYLTSSEAIIETIEANEYEFTEDGELH